MPSHACIIALILTGMAFSGQAAALVRKSDTAVSVDAHGITTMEDQAAHGEEQSRSARLTDVLGEVESMARSGETQQGDKITKIKELVNEIAKDLDDTKKNAQTQVTVNIAAIDKCNDHLKKTLTDVSESTEKCVDGNRTSHLTCRKAEKVKNETHTSRCATLDAFLQTVADEQPNTKLPNGKPRAPMVKYVEALSTYYCPKEDEVTKLNDACKKALAVHAKHKAACDVKQSTFELTFCTWRTQLTDACTAQLTCYEDAKNAYSAHVKATTELVKKWKVEYASLKKILCYVDVWLKDGNAKTVSKEQYDSCNGAKVDTSPMDVDFGTVPDKAECAKLKDPPGTKEFRTTEYSTVDAFVNTPLDCSVNTQ